MAFVAAETEEIAIKALSLIEVEYEELPAILDMGDSLDNETILHDEPEYVDFAESDASRNLAAHIHIDIGDVEQGFAEADHIFEYEYEVPKVQQAHIEPHIVVTYWDEDDRLVIRTSTQVPFHARRILAPVLGLAGQAHPGDQAAHRRRVWRQAGSADRGRSCPPDDRHRATGAFMRPLARKSSSPRARAIRCGSN